MLILAMQCIYCVELIVVARRHCLEDLISQSIPAGRNFNDIELAARVILESVCSVRTKREVSDHFSSWDNKYNLVQFGGSPFDSFYKALARGLNGTDSLHAQIRHQLHMRIGCNDRSTVSMLGLATTRFDIEAACEEFRSNITVVEAGLLAGGTVETFVKSSFADAQNFRMFSFENVFALIQEDTSKSSDIKRESRTDTVHPLPDSGAVVADRPEERAFKVVKLLKSCTNRARLPSSNMQEGYSYEEEFVRGLHSVLSNRALHTHIGCASYGVEAGESGQRLRDLFPFSAVRIESVNSQGVKLFPLAYTSPSHAIPSVAVDLLANTRLRVVQLAVGPSYDPPVGYQKVDCTILTSAGISVTCYSATNLELSVYHLSFSGGSSDTDADFLPLFDALSDRVAHGRLLFITGRYSTEFGSAWASSYANLFSNLVYPASVSMLRGDRQLPLYKCGCRTCNLGFLSASPGFLYNDLLSEIALCSDCIKKEGVDFAEHQEKCGTKFEDNFAHVLKARGSSYCGADEVFFPLNDLTKRGTFFPLTTDMNNANDVLVNWRDRTYGERVKRHRNVVDLNASLEVKWSRNRRCTVLFMLRVV